MKKTLTIMMTAATALLGLNSCNDSSNGSSGSNGSASSTFISTSDFASGVLYYSGNLNGQILQVKCVNKQDAVNPSSVNLAGCELQYGASTYPCSLIYTLNDAANPTEGTFDITFTKDVTTDDQDFLKLWGMSYDPNLPKYQGSLTNASVAITYRIAISFPSGEAKLVAEKVGGWTGDAFLEMTPTSAELSIVSSKSSGENSGTGSESSGTADPNLPQEP